MRIVMAAAEMTPFAKVGGLADVLGALPAALAAGGHDVTVCLPRYAGLRLPAGARRRWGGPLAAAVLRVGDRAWGARYGTVAHGAVRVVLVDLPEQFGERPGVYLDPRTGAPYPDDAERWFAFSAAVAAWVGHAAPDADVVHLHDHHAAWVAPLLEGHRRPATRAPVVVLTLHNAAHRGDAPAALWRAAGLAPPGPSSALAAGLAHADLVTTVSPTYAAELRGAAGDGLEALHTVPLVGILNGIDAAAWDPATDPWLARRYAAAEGAEAVEAHRAVNGHVLRRMVGLAPGRRPLAGFIGRLAWQKGADLVADAAAAAVADGWQLALLGEGDAALEARLRSLADAHPGAVAVRLGFDEPLARLLLAGADILCMPSRFEPCGLVQLYALAYGATPVVRRTGGLADTVRDVDGEPHTGNGVAFDAAAPDALLDGLRRAARLLGSAWRRRMARARGMVAPRTWDVAAREYEAAYREAVGSRQKAVGARDGAA